MKLLYSIEKKPKNTSTIPKEPREVDQLYPLLNDWMWNHSRCLSSSLTATGSGALSLRLTEAGGGANGEGREATATLAAAVELLGVGW